MWTSQTILTMFRLWSSLTHHKCETRRNSFSLLDTQVNLALYAPDDTPFLATRHLAPAAFIGNVHREMVHTIVAHELHHL